MVSLNQTKQAGEYTEADTSHWLAGAQEIPLPRYQAYCYGGNVLSIMTNMIGASAPGGYTRAKKIEISSEIFLIR